MSQSKKSKPPLQSRNEQPMSISEKNKLKQEISMLSIDQQKGIIDIVRDCINQGPNGDVFEFELDALPLPKCREIEQYVKNCIQTN